MSAPDKTLPHGLHKRACMRALFPDKRSLSFGADSLDRVVSYFKKHFPHTTDEMLFAMVMPTEGDISWAGLVLTKPRSRTSGGY